MIEILAGVSFNWTEILNKIVIYTQRHNVYLVEAENIHWSKIPQYPACQILNVTEYFTEYRDESILQFVFFFKQLKNVGVSIFFEEKIKTLSRRLNTNTLLYTGPSFHFADLFLPHAKSGVLSYHQIIHSEKEEKVRCKNYPFDGLESFSDCDKKYLYNKFLHDYQIMPFWIAPNLKHVTNLR